MGAGSAAPGNWQRFTCRGAGRRAQRMAHRHHRSPALPSAPCALCQPQPCAPGCQPTRPPARPLPLLTSYRNTAFSSKTVTARGATTSAAPGCITSCDSSTTRTRCHLPSACRHAHACVPRSTGERGWELRVARLRACLVDMGRRTLAHHACAGRTHAGHAHHASYARAGAQWAVPAHLATALAGNCHVRLQTGHFRTGDGRFAKRIARCRTGPCACCVADPEPVCMHNSPSAAPPRPCMVRPAASDPRPFQTTLRPPPLPPGAPRRTLPPLYLVELLVNKHLQQAAAGPQRLLHRARQLLHPELPQERQRLVVVRGPPLGRPQVRLASDPVCGQVMVVVVLVIQCVCSRPWAHVTSVAWQRAASVAPMRQTKARTNSRSHARIRHTPPDALEHCVGWEGFGHPARTHRVSSGPVGVVTGSARGE